MPLVALPAVGELDRADRYRNDLVGRQAEFAAIVLGMQVGIS